MNKQIWFYYLSTCFCSFLEESKDSEKTFRNYLTDLYEDFSLHVRVKVISVWGPLFQSVASYFALLKFIKLPEAFFCVFLLHDFLLQITLGFKLYLDIILVTLVLSLP